jgi:hypothetical protein
MKIIKAGTQEILVDDEDYQALYERGNWYIDGGYAACGGNTSRFFMHQIIMGFKSGCVIDHINRNKLDNQRKNLRFVSRSVNAHNQKKRSNNRSGYTGVSWKGRNQKWAAGITLNRKVIYIGLYATKEEAALAYNKKAIELYGECANLNIIQ